MKTRSQSKREVQQMEVDEVAYDIFEWFPILVCQNIFKHLDGKAMIQASEVNMEWNKLCTESQQVEKLKFVLNPTTSKTVRAAVNVLQNSKRKYQSIELHKASCTAARLFLRFLADEAESWKSMVFQDCKFDRQMWLNMLRIIEPSVEELTINGDRPEWNFNGDLNLNLIFNFPCLRSLEVGCRDDNMIRHFVRCTNLVKFHWQFWGGGNLTEDLRTFLRNNHKLEDLALSTVATLYDNPSDFSFKLKKLNLWPSSVVFVPEILRSFLETQAQTLETLEVGLKLNQASLELILRMPRLTSLKVSVYCILEAISNWNRAFPVNTTINSLELEYLFLGIDLDVGLTAPLETFIRTLQNLKHFKGHVINDEALLFLVRAAPALKSLETRFFNVTRFPEGNVFPNITKFKAGSFRRDFQEPTGDSPFAALVREGMRENPNRYLFCQ